LKITSGYDSSSFFVVIRHQPEIIASSYSFFCSYFKKISFEEYLEWSKCCTKENPKWNYFSHLNDFEECYGVELKVFVFEEFASDPQRFVRSIMNEYDFDVDMSRIDFAKKNASKKSITRDLIKVAEFFGGKLGRTAAFKLLPNVGKKFVMPEKYRHEIFEYFAGENKLLDEKYGLDLKKYGYY
jgi:hypothetical protein